MCGGRLVFVEDYTDMSGWCMMRTFGVVYWIVDGTKTVITPREGGLLEYYRKDQRRGTVRDSWNLMRVKDFLCVSGHLWAHVAGMCASNQAAMEGFVPSHMLLIFFPQICFDHVSAAQSRHSLFWVSWNTRTHWWCGGGGGGIVVVMLTATNTAECVCVAWSGCLGPLEMEPRCRF